MYYTVEIACVLTHMCIFPVYAYGMAHMSIPVWASHMRIGLPHMHMGRPYAVWVNG